MTCRQLVIWSALMILCEMSRRHAETLYHRDTEYVQLRECVWMMSVA